MVVVVVVVVVVVGAAKECVCARACVPSLSSPCGDDSNVPSPVVLLSLRVLACVDWLVAALCQEGKSAAELEALADAAANDADFFRASHLLYAARVASGDIDTKSTDLGTY